VDPNNTQNLWELVDCADLAVRTASELRKFRSAHRPPDMQVLSRALEFLSQAGTGAAFVSGQATQLRGTTLKPSNWATDAYLRTVQLAEPDYQAIRAYLDQIASVLRKLVSSGDLPPATLDTPILFFEKLGDVIGSRADQTLHAEAEPGLLD